MNLLQVSGITLRKDNGFVLKDISFTQQQFEKIAIAGETGSGKSSLLKIIAGSGDPDAGEVRWQQEKVIQMNEKLIPGHPGIAWLSQYFELPRFLTVEQVLSYASKISEQDAASLYRVCRISHLVKRKTDHLSGGERQRIALARLLSTSPGLLLLDEPFSNLDMINKNILKYVINDIGEKLGISCILVAHDPVDTLSWADKIIVMKDGKIIQKGSPDKVYRQPVNEYTAGLFGKYNLMGSRQARAFSNLNGLDSMGKTLLVRPNHFKIDRIDADGAKGIVQQCRFFGTYYEIDILLSEQKIIAITENATLKKGDMVQVSVAREDVWYI